ncbi:sigma factor-like helix-turn-helix DNA-binding protein [Paenibacillus chitinolyticus]|uniref:sigma factor-like helix-turn-helix DNA-binding protein n=1 Tax=Paenibacillus chitinolyticus TaxID=79263 RepID=UPI00366AAC5E
MNRDKVTELLKNYQSYRYAIRQYENHRAYPAAGIANYSPLRGGSGMPELFFQRIGKPADMGHTTFKDEVDYQAYRNVVAWLEGALETLTEDEVTVIKFKWVRDLTLVQIAEQKGFSETTVKRLHKRGLEKLAIALRFVEVPNIHQVAQIVG